MRVSDNVLMTNYSVLVFFHVLQDAQYAIPKGTLLAILITSSVYVAVAWLAGATILREANGLIPGVVSAASNISGLPSVFDAVTNTSTAATSTFAVDPSTTAASNVLTAESVGNCSLVKDGCTYGLLHDFQVNTCS